ncbi:hypothetical protein ACFL1H_07855 [Nanoarchaeota archaeon]
MKKKSKLKTAIKYLLLSPVVVLGTNQLVNYANDFYHQLYPSDTRKEFKDKYGITLNGWSSDIEMKKSNLTRIAQVLDREIAQKDFKITSIRVFNNNYLKQNFDEIILDAGGIYSPISNSISLRESMTYGTLTHEIKHDKIYEVIRKYPEFLRK